VAFSAFLDACVLVPSRGRDVLLEVAVSGVYRPLWSPAVLDELTRTVRRLRERRDAVEDATDAYVGRLMRQMTQSFPNAMVEVWERIEGSIELPDPNDCHVVAEALIGRADVIVTDNTKDFPAERLPSPLFTQTLDEFLLDSLDLYPAAVISAVVNVAERTGRTGATAHADGRRPLSSRRNCTRFRYCRGPAAPLKSATRRPLRPPPRRGTARACNHGTRRLGRRSRDWRVKAGCAM